MTRTLAPTPPSQLLGRYTARPGRPREVIAGDGAAGSVLVVDRDAITHGDRRLIAHLGADEPAHNASVICRHYLQEPVEHRRRCRLMTSEDAQLAPFDEQPQGEVDADEREVVDRAGCRYRLQLVHGQMSAPQLRWCRRRSGRPEAGEETVSVRAVIGAVESYEPVCALTARALAIHDRPSGTSVKVLRSELQRVRSSSVVLNRLLRQVVLARIERGELSMSEIAMRCGRVKRDRRGNQSGETSWLARRLGLLPESGHAAPTPWIHSDVLALIARDGLGVSPHEVEL